MRARLRSVLFGLLVLAGMEPVAAQERVSFPSSDGDQFGGALFRPAGDGPFPTMILLSGCEERVRWAENLWNRGYVVLLADNRALREQSGPCAGNKLTLQAGEERMRAAYGALLFLQGLPFVRAERVGAIGWSHDATTLLWLMDDDSATMRPRELRYGFAAAIAFNPDCQAAVERDPPWHTWTPLIVLTVENDDRKPALSCLELVKWSRLNGEPADITVTPEGGAEGPDAVPRLPAFLSRYLQH